MFHFLQRHKVENPKLASHVSMIGGKYRICTPESVLEFYELYVKCYMCTPKSLHLVERVQYPSRFYLDLDASPVSHTLVQKNLENLDWGRFIICISDTKPQNIHVVYSDVWVKSVEEAKARCAYIKEVFTDIRECVDESVYFSGLRMIGSEKGRKRSGVYYVVNYPRQISTRLLQNTSIHGPRIGARIQHPPAKVVNEKVVGPVCVREMVYVDFSKIAHRYRNVAVYGMRKLNEILMILHTHERWCSNIQDEHKSVTIYFIVDVRKKEVYQRCHCRCSLRTCKTFTSASQKMRVKDFYTLVNTFNKNRG